MKEFWNEKSPTSENDGARSRGISAYQTIFSLLDRTSHQQIPAFNDAMDVLYETHDTQLALSRLHPAFESDPKFLANITDFITEENKEYLNGQMLEMEKQELKHILAQTNGIVDKLEQQRQWDRLIDAIRTRNGAP